MKYVEIVVMTMDLSGGVCHALGIDLGAPGSSKSQNMRIERVNRRSIILQVKLGYLGAQRGVKYEFTEMTCDGG